MPVLILGPFVVLVTFVLFLCVLAPPSRDVAVHLGVGLLATLIGALAGAPNAVVSPVLLGVPELEHFPMLYQMGGLLGGLVGLAVGSRVAFKLNCLIGWQSCSSDGPKDFVGLVGESARKLTGRST